MANRRQVLQAGLAASALSATGFAFGRSAAAGSARLELECFVCDERYPESVAAAHAAERHGFAVHVTSGDMTDLWYHRLDALWRRRAVAIAGVTGEDALFVLERLGWDRGLRVVYRGRHARGTDGAIQHQLSGTEGLVSMVAEPGAGAWTDRFVAALACCEPNAASHGARRYGAGDPSSAGRGAISTSWLLLPRR